MDIYEFGMKMERDGEKYYRDLAGKCGNAGLKRILTMMADDEVKHFELFKKMKENTDPTISDSLVLDTARNVFEKMKDQGDAIDLDTTQVGLYEKAREIEKKSENFYRGKAAEVKSIPHRKILEAIAEEERKHYNLLGHLIEFVTKPEKWLENAEWHHFEEY